MIALPHGSPPVEWLQRRWLVEEDEIRVRDSEPSRRTAHRVRLNVSQEEPGGVETQGYREEFINQW